jgi:hypothetical protein
MNCLSSDQSTYALVTLGGGITDVHIDGNLAINRPLLNGGYTEVSSSDIWVQNNTLINFWTNIGIWLWVKRHL